jgi:5-carboxymethyl-2-hydroxymuconate isomerase
VPHLTLEYTSNLAQKAPTPDLLLRVHRLLASAAGIRIGNCKSRWAELEKWVVGDGKDESAFVHLSIRHLEGRPLETRQAVGAGALQVLRDHFLPAPEGADLQITVEVMEIRVDAYFKDPPGTLTPPAPVQT